MTATFDPTLKDDVSQVRQRIGDVVTLGAQVQDETIQAYIDQGMTILVCARRLCLDLSALWTRKAATVTIDDQRSDFSKVAAHYLTLAAEIDREMAPVTTTAASGDPGIYVTSGCRSAFYDPSLDC
jgi:hypothetical protein